MPRLLSPAHSGLLPHYLKSLLSLYKYLNIAQSFLANVIYFSLHKLMMRDAVAKGASLNHQALGLCSSHRALL